ncbi:MAG: hypothetical protein E7537_02195 [Ruminococcaceae bacterium]|nr:hypothetical protein [Oscillospiraceae bacterium]
MKFKYNLIAFLFIGLFGTISHFLFEWTGNNKIVGYFFPVNESTWEHLKILFFPTVLFSLIEYHFVKKEIRNYVPSVVISLIFGMVSIITLFYTYKGFLGFMVDFINILIFFIAVIIMLIVKNKLIESEKFKGDTPALIFLSIGFIFALLFVFFTYNPPSIAVFSPPNK